MIADSFQCPLWAVTDVYMLYNMCLSGGDLYMFVQDVRPCSNSCAALKACHPLQKLDYSNRAC